MLSYGLLDLSLLAEILESAPGNLVFTNAEGAREYPRGRDLYWMAWPQTWGDTGCGFGGFAGQAFTTAMTHVVVDEDRRAAAVYHGGRYAYTTHREDDPELWEMVLNRADLPGHYDFVHRRAAAVE